MHTIRQAISAIVVALAFGAALEAQSQRATTEREEKLYRHRGGR
jgi:hypothetical protein